MAISRVSPEAPPPGQVKVACKACSACKGRKACKNPSFVKKEEVAKKPRAKKVAAPAPADITADDLTDALLVDDLAEALPVDDLAEALPVDDLAEALPVDDLAEALPVDELYKCAAVMAEVTEKTLAEQRSRGSDEHAKQVFGNILNSLEDTKRMVLLMMGAPSPPTGAR